MDSHDRDALKALVTQSRQDLEQDIHKELEGTFGILPDGTHESVERLNLTSDDDRTTRAQVEVALEHLTSGGFAGNEAVEQFVREVAFTHLNRLIAFKCMFARGFIARDPIGKGLKSQGFQFYLADHADDERLEQGGEAHRAYRHYLTWLGGTHAQGMPALFDPTDPANRLFPSPATLDALLARINEEVLNEFWKEDETIGWVYQYFTPKEQRDRSRKEAPGAPRTSYELAFRNQFFTPRYVVAFLTDNTLGKIWYDSRGGKTVLAELCAYLIRPPSEDRPTPASRDPRTLRIIDPACGSGHFLLYVFDLLIAIYQEAYDDPLGEGDLALREAFPEATAFRRAIPELILEHNLHGIDIDRRAVQVAGLALWMRAQRYFHEVSIPRDARPVVQTKHLVCAEPMPGDQIQLLEFIEGIRPRVLGQLVKRIFDEMRLAGDAGSLLQIEERIEEDLKNAREAWDKWQNTTDKNYTKKHQTTIWDTAQPTNAGRQSTMFDVNDIGANFWESAEAALFNALESYIAHARRGDEAGVYKRRLWAGDARQGLSFIDVCQQQYDVVLMNPPFGGFVKGFKPIAKERYPNTYNDVFAAFTERWHGKLRDNGQLGAITSRAGFFLTSFTKWRENFLQDANCLTSYVDLGEAVMDDAMVEAAAYVLQKNNELHTARFIRLLGKKNREPLLHQAVDAIVCSRDCSYVFNADPKVFSHLVGSPFAYWIDAAVINQTETLRRFIPDIANVRQGLATADDPRFARGIWEVPARLLWQAEAKEKTWVPYVSSGSSQPYISPITLVVNWRDDAWDIRHNLNEKGNIRSNIWMLKDSIKTYFFRPGFSWTRRAVRFIPYAVPAGCIPSASRYMAFPNPGCEFTALGVTASNVASALLRFYGEKFSFPNFLVDTMKTLPWPELPIALTAKLETVARGQVARRRRAYQNHEPFHDFAAPSWVYANPDPNALAFDWSSILGNDLDLEVAKAYGFTPDEYAALTRDLREAIAANVGGSQGDDAGGADTEGKTEGDEGDAEDGDDAVLHETPATRAAALVSYVVGVIFGRWDVRMATNHSLIPTMAGPFDHLPVCPPGALVGIDGLPAVSGGIVSTAWLKARPNAITLPPTKLVASPTIPDAEYPVRLAWTGIVVDDYDDQRQAAHPDDLTHRVEQVFSVIFGASASAQEAAVCAALDVSSLREYLHKSNGFWKAHLDRYSKSRRKAPLYWFLQSEKKTYGLWLYFHRLDGDLIKKAIVQYVEPKLKLEEATFTDVRLRYEDVREVGGRQARQAETAMNDQKIRVDDLANFLDHLRQIAALNLTPDLNDGVLFNIAAFHSVVPWKDATTAWNDLIKGKYPWSAIGKQLVAKPTSTLTSAAPTKSRVSRKAKS